MPWSRSLLLVLFALLLVHGCSCDDGDDGVRPNPCYVDLDGPTETDEDTPVVFQRTVGSSWGINPNVTWDVDGPAEATVTETRADVREITFPEPGTYTVTITVVPGEGVTCEERTVTRSITVIGQSADCSGELFAAATVSEDVAATFRLELAGGWAPPRENQTYTVDWELLSGPGTFSVDSEVRNQRTSTAVLRFSDEGTYLMRVTATDDRPGNPTCEPVVIEFQVVVTGSGGSPIATGLIPVTSEKPDRLFVAPAGVTRIDSNKAYVACSRGIDVFDLVTRQPDEQFRLIADEPSDRPRLGAIVLTGPTEEPLTLVPFGPGGPTVVGWNPDEDTWNEFGRVLSPFAGTAFDASVNTLDPGSGLWVESNGAVFELFRDSSGVIDDRYLFGSSELVQAGIQLQLPISATGTALGGSVLAVTRGTPGETNGKVVLWHDDGEGFAVSEVADVGDDPRNIRALNGIAVAANFGSDSIDVFTWDGAGSAAPTATQMVGDGPIQVDLRARPGGGVFALTTGFNDGSYSITEIDGGGNVVETTTTLLPNGLTEPPSGVWLNDGAGTFIVSSFGGDALYVGRQE